MHVVVDVKDLESEDTVSPFSVAFGVVISIEIYFRLEFWQKLICCIFNWFICMDLGCGKLWWEPVHCSSPLFTFVDVIFDNLLFFSQITYHSWQPCRLFLWSLCANKKISAQLVHWFRSYNVIRLKEAELSKNIFGVDSSWVKHQSKSIGNWLWV